MILTVFEQNNFTDDREITRNYPYQVDDELMKEMIAILHHAGTGPDQRKEIGNEQASNAALAKDKRNVFHRNYFINAPVRLFIFNNRCLLKQDADLKKKFSIFTVNKEIT